MMHKTIGMGPLTGSALEVPAVAGMTLGVLRRAGGPDCTAGGITSWASQVRVVGLIDSRRMRHSLERVPVELVPSVHRMQVQPLRADTPEVALEVRDIGGLVLSLIPVQRGRDGTPETTGEWTMAGGNYAATSDSRFAEWVEAITRQRPYGALAVHDRIEVP